MDFFIKTKASDLNKNIQSFINFINSKNWNFEQKDNAFQIAFQSGETSKLTNKVHIITVQENKLYSTTALGIKVTPDAYVDTLKFINHLNLEKIYYGRFVITKANEIWYDLTLDLFDHSHDDTIFNSLINIYDGCAENSATSYLTSQMALNPLKKLHNPRLYSHALNFGDLVQAVNVAFRLPPVPCKCILPLFQ